MGKCIAILGEKGKHNAVREWEEERISTNVIEENSKRYNKES